MWLMIINSGPSRYEIIVSEEYCRILIMLFWNFSISIAWKDIFNKYSNRFLHCTRLAERLAVDLVALEHPKQM
jgi:hypothetical protein